MYRRKKIKPFNEQKFSAILLCALSLLIFTLVYLDIEISQFHMIVIALGFFIPFVTYKRYKKKQRTDDLQDYAKKNNYEFYEYLEFLESHRKSRKVNESPPKVFETSRNFSGKYLENSRKCI